VAAPPTDKQETGLLGVYAELFAELRDRPVSMLEIGIERGGSLFHWAGFFTSPDTRILGLDLKVPELSFPERVTTRVCDQNDTRTLARLAAEHGPFDIIIDDGAHFTVETRRCFDTLFTPSLKIGGWYVIEDWAVGYPPWRDRESRNRGMIELMAEIVAKVPELQISEFKQSLKQGQAYAAFRKGAVGWAG
jgi:hypothetical protein